MMRAFLYPALALIFLSSQSAITVKRFDRNPIIHTRMGVGKNINGPSLIRAPSWIKNPKGRYYLYFAAHDGKYIRLAFADKLEGPWRIHEGGVLKLEETICTDHIASPDVLVDEQKREVRIYFHCPLPGRGMDKQVSLVATSADGIKFAPRQEILGDSYFRVFQWGGYHYAMARLGALFRSRDGLTDFEKGPNPFGSNDDPSRVRHTAVMIEGNTLLVFYSRIGDSPERILLSKIDLTRDWKEWKATEPITVIEPEMEYEGARLTLEPSKVGDIKVPVRQLRDPAIFREGRKVYLLYSVAGEQGIGIAEIFWESSR